MNQFVLLLSARTNPIDGDVAGDVTSPGLSRETRASPRLRPPCHNAPRQSPLPSLYSFHRRTTRSARALLNSARGRYRCVQGKRCYRIVQRQFGKGSWPNRITACARRSTTPNPRSAPSPNRGDGISPLPLTLRIWHCSRVMRMVLAKLRLSVRQFHRELHKLARRRPAAKS
jgi:hypothetical protein